MEQLVMQLATLWVAVLGLLIVVEGLVGRGLVERYVSWSGRQLWRPFGFVLGRLSTGFETLITRLWCTFERVLVVDHQRSL
ncbi:MAG: hypothetical protein WCO84_04540 [bacterium]